MGGSFGTWVSVFVPAGGGPVISFGTTICFSPAGSGILRKYH